MSRTAFSPAIAHTSLEQGSTVQGAIQKLQEDLKTGCTGTILENYEYGAGKTSEESEFLTGKYLKDQIMQMAATQQQVSIFNQQTLCIGDLALHTYTWVSASDDNTDKTYDASTLVLRRQPEGEWLVAIEDTQADLLFNQLHEAIGFQHR